MSHVHQAVIDLINRDAEPTEYSRIRELWKVHSIAEDRRDLDGLISTLTEDCVYEIPEKDIRWEGHAGAREFYRGLLTAIPDITFDLQRIVIGPQGVFEEAKFSGTAKESWLDFASIGHKIQGTVFIFFPWDPTARKFKGERIYLGTIND